ncbi:carboxymuconolactone decarboxylase family protein [Mesorhizobium sp. 1M-11]|uniref:carboxymuconolactone decarboxylase family protein n=1 Tax=Mesorhizobium sp. 1M-11 TaxID=1529006 RepID=UPI0006C76E6A|nr:carboxymuconolactone decarboxylase family protein [Mesorhizobium sp. 1M-11]
MQPRLDFFAESPQLMKYVVSLNRAVEESGLDKGLLHLIKLRASQINGCSYCVEMHSREAREDGESEQRLYLVAAWKESPLFTERERMAFKWVETVTRIAAAGVPDELYQEGLQHFSKEELVKLTVAVAMINTWNRLCVTFHAVHPMPTAKAA